MRLVALAAMAITGCGFDCELDDRAGLYLAQTTELEGGTCGSLPDFVVELGAEQTGCSVVSQDISADECQLDITVDCIFPADDLTTRTVASTTQTAPNADEISGTYTMAMDQASTGAAVCVSTYDITYQRQ